MNTNRYLRLRELQFNSYFLDSPVEFEKGALILDTETNTVLLQLRFLTLSKIPISSVTITVEGLDDEGKKIPGFKPATVTFRDVNLSGKRSFGEKTPVILDARTRKVEVSLDKVVLMDGSSWVSPADGITPPKQILVKEMEPELKEQLDRDIDVSLAEHSGRIVYIPEKFSEYWLCSCGRPNTNDARECVRCGIDKVLLFQIFDEKNLLANLEKFLEQERQKEEAERIRLIEEEEQKRIREEEERIRVLDEEERNRIQKEEDRGRTAGRNKKIIYALAILTTLGIFGAIANYVYTNPSSAIAAKLVSETLTAMPTEIPTIASTNFPTKPPTKVPTKKPTIAPTKLTYILGEEVISNGLLISVTEVEDPAGPGKGNKFVPKVIPGHKLIAIEVVLGNMEIDNFYLFSSSLTVIDNEGISYNAVDYALESSYEIHFADELTKNKKIKGWAGFVIPKNSKPQSIVLEPLGEEPVVYVLVEAVQSIVGQNLDESGEKKLSTEVNKLQEDLHTFDETHGDELREESDLGGYTAEEERIWQYCRDRWDYYDSISGGYSGDEYTSQVFEDAATRFGVTPSEAERVWNKVDAQKLGLQ